MAAVFACIYFPLAYLELPYGVSCSVFLSLVVAQSILLLPKTSMGRSDDIAPCLVIFTMLLTASSIIIIAVGMSQYCITLLAVPNTNFCRYVLSVPAIILYPRCISSGCYGVICCHVHS